MKELSIEEKAKRYDEALERACKIKNGEPINVPDGTLIPVAIFPELAESEDERVRKELIEFVKSRLAGFPQCDKYIVWLEKQGKQPDANKEYWRGYREGKQEILDKYATLEKQGEQPKQDNYSVNDYNNIDPHFGKPIDKIEPKFHEGDWIITPKNKVLQITSIENTGYRFNDESHYWEIRYCDEQCRLWTIKDAKDGDVLGNCNIICIFRKIAEEHFITTHCLLNDDDSFAVINDETIGDFELKPATKEQCDLLFQKMKEAGYEWDANKKELKKIKNEIEIPFGAKDSELEEATYYIPKVFYAEIDEDKVVIKKGEKPTAWSEEDENRINRLIAYFEDKESFTAEDDVVYANWLKSLRPQINVTDEELAQAKKDAYNDALDKIEYHSGEPTFDDGWSAAIWYLKKKRDILQSQATWKPSDEQMEALDRAQAELCNTKYNKPICDLIDSLKKLKE